MKIAIWDIETWDLTPTFGPVLCVSVLLQPQQKMVSFRQDKYIKAGKAEDMTDDCALLCDARDLLDQQHLTMGYFSKGFDIAHVNSRLAYHGERLMQPKLHLDPIWFFKGWRGIKAQSGKMKHMAEFFDLDEKKPEVPPEVWMKARGGNKVAMDEVVRRCESDVRITLALAHKALDLGLIRNIGVYP